MIPDIPEKHDARTRYRRRLRGSKPGGACAGISGDADFSGSMFFNFFVRLINMEGRLSVCADRSGSGACIANL